jgi:hypothetical protein
MSRTTESNFNALMDVYLVSMCVTEKEIVLEVKTRKIAWIISLSLGQRKILRYIPFLTYNQHLFSKYLILSMINILPYFCIPL